MRKEIHILLLVLLAISVLLPSAAGAAGQSSQELFETGMDFYNGDGVEQDYAHAFSYFLIAGEINGYAPAQNMLGVCYRDGTGVEQDEDMAEQYFVLAAEQGDADAKRNLELMHPSEPEEAEESVPEEAEDSAPGEMEDETSFLVNLKSEFLSYDNKDCRVKWKVDDKNKALVIYGTGEMEDYRYGAPWDTCEAEYIIICEGVSSVGSRAFWDMETDIRGIYIPASVNTIEDECINSDTLTEIYVSRNSQHYCAENGVLFNKEKTELIKYPSALQEQSYRVPDTVEVISDYAFYCTDELKSVELPASVSNLSPFSIYGTLTIPGVEEVTVSSNNNYYVSENGLVYSKDLRTLILCPCGKTAEKLSLPAGLCAIGEYAFSNVSGVESIVLPDSVREIGRYAFSSCGSKKITMNSGLESMGESAFEGCRMLMDISIAEGLPKIPDRAFALCSRLQNISLPESVTAIGDEAFLDCDSLISVNYSGDTEGKSSIAVGSGNSSLSGAAWTVTSSSRPFAYFLDSGSMSGETETMLGIHADWSAISENDGTVNLSIDVFADHRRMNYSARGKIIVTVGDYSRSLYSPDINDIHTTPVTTPIGSFNFNIPVDKSQRQTALDVNICWEFGDNYYLRDGSLAPVPEVKCNQRIILSNEKSPENLSVGDSVYFGKYETDDKNPLDENDRLEWTVIGKEYGKVLLITKYCIDTLPFEEDRSLNKADWESSSIRGWLNEEFYNTAFSSDEQKVIIRGNLFTSMCYNRTPTSGNTIDSVFLLSDDEYDIYLKGKEYSMASATPYAEANGIYVSSDNENSRWWLRSLANQSKATIASIDAKGELLHGGEIIGESDIGVRPAIWVDVSGGTSTTTPAQTNTKSDPALEKGQIVTFGKYEQDNVMKNGDEPLEWVVIDARGDNVMLLCRNCVYPKQYHGLENCSWGTTNLRIWLNDQFRNAAFGKAEQSAIVRVELENDSNPRTMADGGNPTLDEIFIPSLTELNRCLDGDFQAFTTAKAKEMGAKTTKDDNGNLLCKWWVRTPGQDERYAVIINEDGSVDYNGLRADTGNVCVRPAIWVNSRYFR